MIALWIIIGILLLIFLILLIPATVSLNYGETTELYLKLAFLKAQILPKKKDKAAEKKKEKPVEESSKKTDGYFAKLKKERGFAGAVEEICSEIRIAADELLPLIRKIVIRKFDLHITVSGEDAAKAALNYGAVCSAVYPLRGMLSGLMKFRENNVEIKCDFDNNKNDMTLLLQAELRLIFVAAALAGFAVRYFWNRHKSGKEYKKTTFKDGAENERKE